MTDIHVTALETPADATAAADAAVVETAPDAAVKIAEIQADRDVAIATIAADTTVAAIAAEQEDDDVWLRDLLSEQSSRLAAQAESLVGLQTAVESLSQLLALQTEALANLTGLLMPSPPSETEAAPMPTAPESLPDATAADGPRANQEPAAAAEKPKRRLQYL